MTGSPSDHELLIMHSGQLRDACKMIGETKATLSGFIDKIDARCEVRRTELNTAQDMTMKIDTFWKILTVLVVVLMAMSVTMGLNRTVSLQNEIHIQHNTALIKKNGKMLNLILRDLVPPTQRDED